MPQQVARGPERGFPMDTALLVLILSIVALHVAALGGGGLVWAVMKLFGLGQASLPKHEPRESTH